MTNQRLRAALAAMLLAALAPINALAGAATSPPTRVDSAQLDQAIARHMQEGGLVGIGAAILVDQKVVWMKGYGYASRERGMAFRGMAGPTRGSRQSCLRARMAGRGRLCLRIRRWRGRR